MERPALKRLGLVAGVTASLLVLGALARWLTGPSTASLLGGDSPPRRVVPDGTRIRVEVLNATTTRGLARRATLHLRDLGFDVVEIGSSPERLDSTVVIDRAGNAEWARLASEALGGARVETRADPSRYLDITVLLGSNWRPPAQPLYP